MPSQGKWEGLDARRCLFSRKNEPSTRTDAPLRDRTRPQRTRMPHRVTGQDLNAHGCPIKGQDETSTRTDAPLRDKTRPRRARMTRRVTRRDLNAHGWLAGERDGNEIEGGDKKNAPNDPARGGLKRCGSSGDVRLGWGEGSEVLTPKRK